MELVSVEATDFCVLSHVEIELAKQGLVFVFADNRDSNGATSNGAGKTTIFKAITWALYGECVDGDKGDEVIRRGTKKATVKVVIADGDTTWTVTRTRTKGKPRLTLERESYDDPGNLWPIEEKRELLDARIIDLIGLDFHAFKNTVLYGANDIVKFADPRTKDADRKAMLHCILRTSILQTAHRKALDRAKEVRGEMAKVDRKIDRLDASISAVNLPAIKTRRDAWKAKHERELQMNVDKAKVNRDEAERLKAIDYSDGIANLEKRIASLNEQHEAALKRGESVEAIDKEMEAATAEHSKLRNELTRAETKLEGIEDSLAELGDGDTCPLCHGSLNEGGAATHVAELQARKTKGEKYIEAKRAEVEAWKQKLLKLKGRRREAMEAVRESQDIAKRVRGAERDKRAMVSEQEQAARDLETSLKAARMYVERAKELRAEKNPHTAAYKEAKAKVDGYIKESEALGEQRAEHDMMLAHIQFWSRGFSNKGLPSFVLDSVMPLITDRANHYLETLADGDITMDFRTQRELKSAKGEVRDDITIVTTIEGNEGVTPSSGQRTKMNVATDLALMDLVSNREQGHLNLLMLDEVLDGLDDEGTERVLALLQELRTRRDSIFVISHGTHMSEIFEHGLRVTKESGAATVERIA